MPEKCKDCCSRLFCMFVAEVNGEDFETMANKKDCRKRVFTNADSIRAMSDEELCKFLAESQFCDICEEGCDNCTYNGECDKRLLAWLKQPAK